MAHSVKSTLKELYMKDTTPQPKRVLVTGVSKRQDNFDYTMIELGELAKANNLNVVGEVRQNVDQANHATYFGKGKVQEIKEQAIADDVDIILINDELSPSQIRNLEKELGISILDRTQLILEIFANRAQTKEAQLQVAIAEAKYQLPRLHPSDNKLDQQNGGGGGTNRGTGETQLELDRRLIDKRITKLKGELAKIDQQQATQRQQRDKNPVPVVALVGYTNAGKSTTMNRILQRLSPDTPEKQVFEKNMLFATLDTSVREITLPNQQKFLLSDTVGFVSKLPHHLVQAFKATLAEAAGADLLIHVVDYSDPNYLNMMQTTQETLESLGIKDIPMIEAYNKADLKPDTRYPEIDGTQLVFSARDEVSIDALIDLIDKQLFGQYPIIDFLIPYTEGQAVTYLSDHVNILEQSYEEDGTHIKAQINPDLLGPVQKYTMTTD